MFDDSVWNPWHGCAKYSEGCRNCYVYRRDESVGRDASKVERNKDFDKPLRRDRFGNYKIKGGSTVYACMTSDFFLDKADQWRDEAWDIIRTRSDVDFCIITKRITRFVESIPDDWGDGWDNVTICVTTENQQEFDRRFPVFKDLPIKHKRLICEPLLSKIDTHGWLCDSKIEGLVAGGESGNNARICDYNWILSLCEQCADAGVPFHFKQTGARFLKDGRIYRVPRRLQHEQARKANINTSKTFKIKE